MIPIKTLSVSKVRLRFGYNALRAHALTTSATGSDTPLFSSFLFKWFRSNVLAPRQSERISSFTRNTDKWRIPMKLGAASCFHSGGCRHELSVRGQIRHAVDFSINFPLITPPDRRRCVKAAVTVKKCTSLTCLRGAPYFIRASFSSTRPRSK